MSQEVHAVEDPGGWTFRFRDPIVTQLRVDNRFSLVLGGGALVVLEGRFELRRGGIMVRVPPGEVVFEVAEALPLFNSRLDEARASSSGDLRLDFGDDVAVVVPVNPVYESWQIVMSDGEMWVGTPGGGVQHIAAH